MLQIDYRYVYDGHYYWMLIDGVIFETRLDIEMRYGEFYSATISKLGGEHIKNIPDGYGLYKLFNENILFFNKFEAEEFLQNSSKTQY